MQLHAQRILMRTVTSPVSTSQRHPSNISPPCRARRCITAAATGNTPAAGDSKSPTSSPTMQPPIPTNEMAPAPKGVLGRIKRFFVGEKMDRERLKALGLGAVASYGMLSNLVYCTGMAVTWILFVKQRGISPLAAGQWGAYLAFYAGFWTINNFIRPFRFGVAVAMAPVFDQILDRMQATLRLKTKRTAFGVYVAALGVVTCMLTFGSIGLFAGPQAFARA